jgi:hypothetical protein
MKRITKHVLISAMALSITAGVAFAASVHFKNSQPVTATNNGSALTLTVCAGLTGLGNGDVTIQVDATATPTATCTNKGGTQAPGQNPAEVDVSGVTIIPASQIKNGNVSFCVTTVAPPQPSWYDAGCANSNWTAQINTLTFTSYTIKVVQGGNTVLTQTF